MLQLANVQEPVRVCGRMNSSSVSKYLHFWWAIIGSNILSLQAAIWYALDNYCYEDAVFLAERLNAESKYTMCAV